MRQEEEGIKGIKEELEDEVVGKPESWSDHRGFYLVIRMIGTTENRSI